MKLFFNFHKKIILKNHDQLIFSSCANKHYISYQSKVAVKRTDLLAHIPVDKKL